MGTPTQIGLNKGDTQVTAVAEEGGLLSDVSRVSGPLCFRPATHTATFILSRDPGVRVASHSPALREGFPSLTTEGES